MDLLIAVLITAVIITSGFLSLYALLTHDPEPQQQERLVGFSRWEDPQ